MNDPDGSRPDLSSGGEVAGSTDRQTFATEELAIVLSHYDIGPIDAIHEFPRGSRKAPKMVLRCPDAMYLLKRRAKGKDDAYKVAFSHSLQMVLIDRQFPLPHLIGTRADNNSMLRHDGQVYELFEYIKGSAYGGSLEATADAGKTLALFHRLLRGYTPEFDPPTGSYHASGSVSASINIVPDTLERLDSSSGQRGEVTRLTRALSACYHDACGIVEEAGLRQWPMQIVHSDWHPGNMLFRGDRVVAVIDYDAARLHQRVTDAANGALQFSIMAGREDPSLWPDYVDESRYKRFLRGYDSVPECVLSRAELRVIPWLMIEALVAESVIPIANTGMFARMEGLGFLQMVERKVRWMQENADKLVAAVDT